MWNRKGNRTGNPIIHRSCTLTTAQAMIQEQASCETEYWEPKAGQSRKRERTKGKAEGETYLESNEKQLVSGRKRRKNQANKSTGWMPRHHTPKKVVASCEKLRGAASRL